MIADVKKNSSVDELKKYVNYCISPKRNKGNEPASERERRKEMRAALKKGDRITSERVAAYYSDEMEARPSQVDDFVAQLDRWTIEQKRGRPATAKTPRAIMGTFAWSPEDKVTPSRAVELAREYLQKEMGPAYRPGMFVCHTDTDHTHVHFVVAAVGSDGEVYDPAGRGQLYRRMELVMEAMENDHGFKKVQQRKAMAVNDRSRDVVLRADKGVDLQKAERTGKATPDMLLRARLTHAYLRNTGNMDDFLAALDRAGVRWKANVKEGRVAGLSFAMADAPEAHGIAAGKMGRAFVWSSLSRTMKYDYAQHFDMMRTHGREVAERLIEQGGKAPDMAEIPRRREEPAQVVEPIAPTEPLLEGDELKRWMLGMDFTQDDIDFLEEQALEKEITLGEAFDRMANGTLFPIVEEQEDYLGTQQQGGLVQVDRTTGEWDDPDQNRKSKGDDYGYGY